MKKKFHCTTLIISGTIIQMQGRQPLVLKRPNAYKPERYSHFLTKKNRNADIKIAVEVVKSLPEKKGKDIFKVNHFENGEENWRWLKTNTGYLYKCPLGHKRQLAAVSRDFSRVTIYLLPHNGRYVWDYRDIVYDFLQILLINYLAFRKEGLILHAMAVKDVNGRGIVCAGRSGNGKSTISRLWHYNSKAMVLNDDRVIVRKTKEGFTAYGSPWHGEFNDYLESHPDSAPLNTLFIIEHADKNFTQKLAKAEIFKLLYPALIPIFWDNNQINNVLTICEDLIERVACLRLGFMKNKKVIDFIRKNVDQRNTI